MNINLEEMKFEEIKNKVMSLLKETNSDYKTLMSLLTNDKRKTVQNLNKLVQKHVDALTKESCRVENMYKFDKQYMNKYNSILIAGVDEVGRGPLAGPIVAAAVVLKLDYEKDKDLILKINDSKKLSEKTREELNLIIKEKAISCNISEISNEEIDAKGIAWCNNEVLKRAVLGLNVTPSLVLSDGYAVKDLNIENEFIIKGDSKSASIACASIVAKVYRDNLMKQYNSIYPGYGFDRNSGYGTKEHVDAIKCCGSTKIHRMSFLKNIINHTKTS